ncbi:MAG TPA: histidine kinase [Candidatus Deferrimicrobiaceae bacterium]
MRPSAPFLLALLFLPLSTGWALPSLTVQETRRVLVLFSQEKGHPAHDLTEQGIRQTFRSGPAFDVDLYIEYLDGARFPAPSHAAGAAHFLHRKYAGRKIDAIIAVYPAAVDFLLGYGKAVFPRVPIVACEVSRAWAERLEGSPSRRRVTGVIIAENTGGVLETALRMRPGTRRVALIAGISRNDIYTEQIARKGLEPFAGRLEVIDLTRLPMEETLARVSSLPPDTVVFYGSILRDGSGRTFVPREALSLVSRAANAPVFGLYESYMGYGIVGGRLASFERPGRTAAGLALRVLSGESPGAIPFAGEGEYVELYDGRELARWEIPDTAVPPGSAILYREPSLWAAHRWEVLLVLALLSVQSALIAGLVIHRSRRRNAERALHLQKDELVQANQRLQEEASERERFRADLQASREEYRRLAGNLLTSQEKERRRLARELHDDITQRLAALSIEAGKLEREPRESPEPLGRTLRGIGKELMQLSSDVHSLSRQLHPSILDDLGLSEAMRGVCARFSRREGIEVSYEPEDVPRDLSGDVKLCLYRVLQEGLRNVAMHACATRVRVRLAGDGGALRFAMEDDGSGFSTEGMGRHPGLGLISMRERVHLAGGEFSLEAKPGKGTVIRVTVPARSTGGGN